MALTVQVTLDKLSRLDLSTYPIIAIKDQLLLLGTGATLVKTFHKGEEVLRARVNCNFEEFSKASEMSYAPPQLNRKFQRASTPNLNMFYGAINSDDFHPYEFKNVIGLMEVSRLMQDKTITEGEQKITFGTWTVTQDFDLVSIFSQLDDLKQNSRLKEMRNEYLRFCQTMPPDIVYNSLLISNYFADQFAKSETPNDYDYLISALFTEHVTLRRVEDKLLSGVLYPSVRTEGTGFNVAFTPWCADNCLQLVAVTECTIYKKNHKTMVDNDKQAVLQPGQTDFVLKPITDPKYHAGREAAYKKLNSND